MSYKRPEHLRRRVSTGPMSETVLLCRGDNDAVEIRCTTSPDGTGRKFYTADELTKGDVIVHGGQRWLVNVVNDWSGFFESEASHQQ